MNSKKILDKINKLIVLVNQNIGQLVADYDIPDDYDIRIKFSLKKSGQKPSKIATFLYDKIQVLLKAEDEVYFITEYEEYFLLVYHLDKDGVDINERVINTIIKDLYFAVDEAKVEFCFYIEKDNEHLIPNEVYWQLDEWNDNCYENIEEEYMVEDDDLIVYKFPKESLYGVTLGYFAIEEKNIESDFVPELLGHVFGILENFCYVTGYEDEEYIYIYSSKELDDDDILEIENAIFVDAKYIAISDPEETLEDVFREINEEE